MNLDWVKQATRIVIEDLWSGFSPAAPIVLEANLVREDDGRFVGEVTLRVGYDAFERKETHPAAVPKRTVGSALALLAKMPTVEGEYTPFCDHTDDSPEIRMRIEAEGKSLELVTESQGKDHVPWQLETDGKKYVVESDVVARALRSFDRHVSRKRLNSMVKECVET